MELLQVSDEKSETIENTLKLLNKYEIIAAADLYKVSSGMLQDIRRQLRDRMTIKCVKNTLMQISLHKAKKRNSEEFMNAIIGPNVFLFTNGNPFKIAMELDANKVKVFAKPGDIALDEITISAGNTGLSPGPLIGKFGALGIRTRIESGNIWVTRDVVAAKKGDIITDDLADLLQRMGIRAAEMGLRIKAVYEKGEIIPGEALLLDLNEYQTNISTAIINAYLVAVQLPYFTPETTPIILIKALQEAKSVAVEAGYINKETAEIIISKVNAQARSARSLASKVGAILAQVP
jgi:large subunit ribosomal protein L10